MATMQNLIDTLTGILPADADAAASSLAYAYAMVALSAGWDESQALGQVKVSLNEIKKLEA